MTCRLEKEAGQQQGRARQQNQCRNHPDQRKGVSLVQEGALRPGTTGEAQPCQRLPWLDEAGERGSGRSNLFGMSLDAGTGFHRADPEHA